MKINTLFAALCVALTATPFCQAQDDGDFFEKSLVECPVTAEWWPGALFNRVALRDGAQAGDKIIISYEIIPGAESPKFCLCTNYGKRSLPGFEGTEHDVNADENRDRYNMLTTNYGNRNMPGFPSAEYDGQDGTHVMHLAESGSFIYPITADVRTKLADSSFHGWGQVNITGAGFKMLGLYRREYREPGTGIDAIVADSDNDNAPVEFYNLQGIKVANPANGGVYIRRQGNKVTKVIVR